MKRVDFLIENRHVFQVCQFRVHEPSDRFSVDLTSNEHTANDSFPPANASITLGAGKTWRAKKKIQQQFALLLDLFKNGR